MPPILYLIDGHALAYRTYFALTAGSGSDRWTTSAGEPTASIYGFASVLLRLLEQEKPQYLAVAFDTGKTFRNELFPAYKATRAKMPDDLRPQIERIRQMVDAFHVPRLEVEGAEADDILGTIARQAVAQGFGVKIITGDRDLLQLVEDRIIVNLPGSKLADARDYTARDVKESLGVEPEQVVDYKALVGDKSDNIPGVPGIGEKTATSLLAQYRTLDEIYAHLAEIPSRYQAKLETGRDSAYMSRTLATIRTDIDVSLKLDDAHTDHINAAEVEKLFHELEFRTLIPRLHAVLGGVKAAVGQMDLFGTEVRQLGVPPAVEIQVQVVQDKPALDALTKALSSASMLALDTETTSTDPMRAELVGISLAISEGAGWYIPVGHKHDARQLPLEEVRAALLPILTDRRIQKVGHNIKYDLLVLANHGMPVEPVSFDTMIAGWLVNPASRALGLKDMAADFLGVSMTHIEELIGKGKNQRCMSEVPIEQAAPYAAADAEVTLRLHPRLVKQMDKVNAGKIFTDIEMPLVPVLMQMEQTGVALDAAFLQKFSAEIGDRMAAIETQIYDLVGQPFNLNSTQQLSRILFDTLKLEPPDRGRKTASGHFSTSADVLDELRGKHPVVDSVLEYRELSKLKSTYLDALPLQVNPVTGRVHTSFNQTGSVTGRLASSDPNLQNIPTRTDLGRQVRVGFTAKPGNLLLSVDYSQIELRIVAHMAKDEAMLNAFRAGQDIHAATAAAVMNIPLDQVTPELRRRAKAINFGLIYGMSPFGLSRGTDLTLAEAENFVRSYFEQFPGVKHFLDGLRLQAARQGYVETMLGRRRFFPNLGNTSNVALRNREEREAINAPIQGTAADIIKLAMIRLPGALLKAGLKACLTLQVHDELVLEVPAAELKETVKIVQDVMENALPLSIPLETDARCGKNWGALMPVSDYQNTN